MKNKVNSLIRFSTNIELTLARKLTSFLFIQKSVENGSAKRSLKRSEGFEATRVFFS